MINVDAVQEGIPHCVVHDDIVDRRKIVLVYHGAHQCVEDVAHSLYVRALAMDGCMVVVPEIPMHGQRASSPERYNPDRDRFNVVLQAGMEARHLVGRYTSPSARVCAVGSSLGGLCAMAAGMAEHRISMIGLCISHLSWAGWRNGLPLDLVNRFDSLSPDFNIKELSSKRILCMVGEFDKWAAPDGIAREIDGLRIQQWTGELQWEVVPGCGHNLSLTMQMRLAHWVVASLNVTPVP